MATKKSGIPLKIWFFAGISIVLSMFLILVSALGFAASNDKDIFEGSVYLAFYSITIIGASISLLFKRFKLGGAIIGIFGLIIAIGIWFIGIPLAVIGLAAFRTEMDFTGPIKDALMKAQRLRLEDLSRMTGMTEADIEITVNKMMKKGERVQFDREKREVFI